MLGYSPNHGYDDDLGPTVHVVTGFRTAEFVHINLSQNTCHYDQKYPRCQHSFGQNGDYENIQLTVLSTPKNGIRGFDIVECAVGVRRCLRKMPCMSYYRYQT